MGGSCRGVSLKYLFQRGFRRSCNVSRWNWMNKHIRNSIVEYRSCNLVFAKDENRKSEPVMEGTQDVVTIHANRQIRRASKFSRVITKKLFGGGWGAMCL